MPQCDKCAMPSCRDNFPGLDLGMATHTLVFTFGGNVLLCTRCAFELTHAVDSLPECKVWVRQHALCDAYNKASSQSSIDANVYADAALHLHNLALPLQQFVIDWLGPKPKEEVE